MNHETLASEVIADQAARARRWRIAFIVSAVVWLCTVAAIVVYVNSP